MNKEMKDLLHFVKLARNPYYDDCVSRFGIELVLNAYEGNLIALIETNRGTRVYRTYVEERRAA